MTGALVDVIRRAAPPLRLVLVTGARCAIGGTMIALAALLPDLVAQSLRFVGHAFVVMSVIGLAAHIEAAVLGIAVDRVLTVLGRAPGNDGP